MTVVQTKEEFDREVQYAVLAERARILKLIEEMSIIEYPTEIKGFMETLKAKINET